MATANTEGLLCISSNISSGVDSEVAISPMAKSASVGGTVISISIPWKVTLIGSGNTPPTELAAPKTRILGPVKFNIP